MTQLHRLLQRQLKRHFGAEASIPDEWQEFIRDVNDVYQGESPVRLEKKPQVYQLLIKKNGYREIHEEIVIEDNITKNIYRDLDPVLGEVHIDSSPPHAKVWLNSEYVGYTPIRSNIPPGIYTVRITKPGYRNFVEEVHIKEEAFMQLKPELEKEQ